MVILKVLELLLEYIKLLLEFFVVLEVELV